MEAEEQKRRQELRLFASPQDMFDQILNHLPELATIAADLSAAISYFGSAAYTTHPSGAVPVITAQAINDFVDGLWDCLACRGRPALRAARTLFESLVNLLDVINRPELEERYLDHLAVVEAATADIKTTPGFITRKERIKRLLTKRRRDKALRERLVQLESKYGKRFVTQWHPTDLRTRADSLGLADDYTFFRKSSAVLHGASAGKTGLVADTEGLTHFRTGPALELCQIAYPYILRFFKAFVNAYRGIMTDDSLDELTNALDRCDRLSPRYVALVAKIDRAAWPKHPVPAPCAVAVIHGETGIRWYLHDVPNGRIKEARLKGGLADDQVTTLDFIADVATKTHTTEPLSIAFVGVEVEPLEDAQWFREEEILLPPDP